MKTPQHVMITGGGSGLGKGLALRYLQRGCKVSVLDLVVSEQCTQQLSTAANEHSTQCQFYTVDITDFNALNNAVATAVKSFGPPALAIHCAGVVFNRSFADTQPADFQRVVNINLNGSYHFAAAVLPTMSSGSRLALVASVAGLISNYGYAAYGASKFGVMGLATTLRYEYEPQGIHISCICPPEVKTPMIEQEQAHGNPISLELKKMMSSLDTNTACDHIVKGLDAGRWQIIPGAYGKFTISVARHFPGAFNGVMQGLIRRALRKHQ